MNRRVSHQSESHLRLGMASSAFKKKNFLPQPGTVVQRVISSVQKQDNMGDKWHLGEASCLLYIMAVHETTILPVRVGIPLRLGSNSNPPLQRGDDLGTGLGASPWRIFPSRPFSNNRDIINCNLCNQASPIASSESDSKAFA